MDVQKSINEEYASLVNIIAKDVKTQVEFNPEVVEQYRLRGFENRALAREYFTSDKVISEPFGSGGYGVALYELTMKTGSTPADSGLKYSRLITTGSQEPGTVKVRYKEPLEDVSHELEKAIATAEASFTDNLRLAFIVYVCAEKLRGSDKISNEEMKLARKLYAETRTFHPGKERLGSVQACRQPGQKRTGAWYRPPGRTLPLVNHKLESSG